MRAAGGPARRRSSVPFVQALCSVRKGRMASAFSRAAEAHGPHWLLGFEARAQRPSESRLRDHRRQAMAKAVRVISILAVEKGPPHSTETYAACCCLRVRLGSGCRSVLLEPWFMVWGLGFRAKVIVESCVFVLPNSEICRKPDRVSRRIGTPSVCIFPHFGRQRFHVAVKFSRNVAVCLHPC